MTAIAHAGSDDGPLQGDRVDLLEFPGGNIEQFMKTVREALGHENIVLELSGIHPSRFKVPELRLRNVSIQEVMELLGMVASFVGDEVWWDGKQPVLRVRRAGSIWLAQVLVPPPPPAQAPWGQPGDKGEDAPATPPKTTQVYSIADILVVFSAEDILTGIETALGLQERQEPASEIRLHEATGLLVAHSTLTHANVVKSTIDQLRIAADTKHRGPQYIPREQHNSTVIELQTLVRELQEAMLTLGRTTKAEENAKEVLERIRQRFPHLLR